MKKLVIASIIGAIGVLGGVGVYVLGHKTKNATPTTAEALQAATPTIAPIEYTTWTDDVGFSFEYPKDASVNKHEEDNDSYAHVEITSAHHPGSIIVWAKDLPKNKKGKVIAVIADWPATDARLADASSVDSTLGEQPAKKIVVTTPKKTTYIGTISDGLLFIVEATPEDETYWNPVLAHIDETFHFGPSTKAKESGSAAVAGDDSGAVDEEEVIE